MSDSINEQRCLHDHHITTSSGDVMGQQNRDGSGWERCAPGPSVVTPPAQDEQHRIEFGNFGWACSCGAGREWPLAPVARARAAAQAHQRARVSL